MTTEKYIAVENDKQVNYKQVNNAEWNNKTQNVIYILFIDL